MPKKPTLRDHLWILGSSLAVAAVSCASPCQNEIFSEVQSPNGLLKAIVFQRDCGATTGFFTEVSILDQSEDLPNETGNVFTVDDDHGKATSGQGRGPRVLVRWLSNNEIEISSDPNARVFLKEISYKSVMIRHITLPAKGA